MSQVTTMLIAIVVAVALCEAGQTNPDELVPESTTSELAIQASAKIQPSHVFGEAKPSRSQKTELVLTMEDASAAGRRRKNWFTNTAKKAKKTATKTTKAVTKTATNVVNTVSDAAKQAYNDALEAANDAVDNAVGVINDMGSSHTEFIPDLVNVGANAYDIIAELATNILDTEEEDAVLAQTESHAASFGVPDLKEIKFDITDTSFVSVPETAIEFSAPDWMGKAKTFFANGKDTLVRWVNSILQHVSQSAWGKGMKITSSMFDAHDGMLLGPACSGSSFAIQLTATIEAGGAYYVGAGVGAEVGFQFGCMDSLEGDYKGNTGSSKRYVIVPMWGIGAAVSAGFATPSASIAGNVYYYSPFSFYESFGHEISIGAEGGWNAAPGTLSGVAADVIFGCCTSPLANEGVPINLVTETKTFLAGTALEVKLTYPISPFVEIQPTGAHVQLEFLTTPGIALTQNKPKSNDDVVKYKPKREEKKLRVVKPSTGEEIKTWKRPGKGNYEMMEPVTLLQDTARARTRATEVTINVGYARACRKFDDSGDCFTKFNP